MAKEIKEHTLISSIFFEKTFKKIPFSDLLHYNILHKTVQFQNDGYKLVFNNEEKKTFDKNYILKKSFYNFIYWNIKITISK